MCTAVDTGIPLLDKALTASPLKKPLGVQTGAEKDKESAKKAGARAQEQANTNLRNRHKSALDAFEAKNPQAPLGGTPTTTKTSTNNNTGLRI